MRSPDGCHKLVSERFAGRAQDGVAENVKGTPVDLRKSRTKEWGKDDDQLRGMIHEEGLSRCYVRFGAYTTVLASCTTLSRATL